MSVQDTKYRVTNMSNKPFGPFDADGKTHFIPPKMTNDKRQFWALKTAKVQIAEMALESGFIRVPRLHPVTREPVLRNAYRTVVAPLEGEGMRKGAIGRNWIEVNRTVFDYIFSPAGAAKMKDCGIDPAEIVASQGALDALERKIELTAAEVARREKEAEDRIATMEAEMHKKLAALAEQEELAKARLEKARSGQGGSGGGGGTIGAGEVKDRKSVV